MEWFYFEDFTGKRHYAKTRKGAIRKREQVGGGYVIIQTFEPPLHHVEERSSGNASGLVPVATQVATSDGGSYRLKDILLERLPAGVLTNQPIFYYEQMYPREFKDALDECWRLEHNSNNAVASCSTDSLWNKAPVVWDERENKVYFNKVRRR